MPGLFAVLQVEPVQAAIGGGQQHAVASDHGRCVGAAADRGLPELFSGGSVERRQTFALAADDDDLVGCRGAASVFLRFLGVFVGPLTSPLLPIEGKHVAAVGWQKG